MRNANLTVFCQAQQRMERIAIERVSAAWKRSTENRPYGGEAQVVSSAGRPLSNLSAILKRNFKDYVRLWKLERHRGNPARARADNDQTIR